MSAIIARVGAWITALPVGTKSAGGGGGGDLYRRPGAVDQYKRPGGVDDYLRP